jgi:hypothetical protein
MAMNLNLTPFARPAGRICAAGCAFGAQGGLGQVLAIAEEGAPPGALMSQEAR